MTDKPLKILLHSNANFVDSGYGVQTDLVSRWLAQKGHEVLVSAFYGLRGATLTLNGIKILPGSSEQWGNDILVSHYEFERPDVLFALMDAWVLEPSQLDMIPAAVWTPVDHQPLPPRVMDRLHHVRWPVAMSRFGDREMRKAMLDPFYVPHMVDTNTFQSADRQQARQAFGIPEDTYFVSIVGANKGFPARKSLDKLLKAWMLFTQKYPNSLLYIHANPYPTAGGLDLIDACEFYTLKYHVGSLQAGETLKGYQIAFPDLYRMARGDYSNYTLNNLYNASDLHILPSMGGGFEIPLIEAQAAGCPIATTDFTAMSELAEAGYKIPVDPIDDYVYTLQSSEQCTPKVTEIVKALEWGYEHRNDENLRSQAREFAMGYEWELVMNRHMYPAMKIMAQGNADWMAFRQYRRAA